MEQHPQVHRFTWQGIEIEVIYSPVRWGVIAHLEISSIEPPRTPLPITETGYRSHFHPCGTVEANGGDVVAQVTAWLDEEAARPEWRRYVETSRQGELFGNPISLPEGNGNNRFPSGTPPMMPQYPIDPPDFVLDSPNPKA